MKRNRVRGTQLLLAVAGGAGLVACGAPPVTVDNSVLGIHVSGSWSGDIRSPRSFTCTKPTFDAGWVGTLGDRIVKLELIDIPGAQGGAVVRFEGGTTGGITIDPYTGNGGLNEGTIAARLTDEMNAELHDLGGTMVVGPDGRSGSLDLRDADLHVTGTWRC